MEGSMVDQTDLLKWGIKDMSGGGRCGGRMSTHHERSDPLRNPQKIKRAECSAVS